MTLRTAIGLSVTSLCVAVGSMAAAIALVLHSPSTSEVNQLRTQVSGLQSSLGVAEQKLNATSTTGDLITCTDLRQLTTSGLQVTTSGIDSYGNYQSFSGSASSPWVPSHCYKQ